MMCGVFQYIHIHVQASLIVFSNVHSLLHHNRADIVFYIVDPAH
jgi:hypothetical protein